jgi:HSP20 family protein
MNDTTKPNATPHWLVVLLVVMAVLLGLQSLFLFKLWRGLRQPETQAGLAETAQRGHAQRSDSAKPPRDHGQGVRGPFGDLDELWRDFEKEAWSPLDEFNRMREQMDSLFNDSFSRFSLTPGAAKRGDQAFAFSPNLDLQDKGDSYVARMDIPGADKNNISVTLEDRVLTVSGQINEVNEKTDGDQVLRKERRSGSFKRSVTLPGAVVADQLNANYENGVLTVTVPKAKEDKQSKTIQVK